MKLIDISHPLGGDTPLYPGDYPTCLTQYKAVENDGYTAFVLRTGLHTGTHIDFPLHLTGDKRTASDFPADIFVGDGVFLDVRGEDIIRPKNEYVNIPVGSIVLLYTGFERFWGEDKYFTNHPVISVGFAKMLTEKKIKLIGMDMPSPDFFPFEIHKMLLTAGIPILENATNLSALQDAAAFEVIALPLNISAEASPVRAVCRLKQDLGGMRNE